MQLQWRREIRPGERELIKRITNNTTSTVYGAVQALRTPEYITRVRSVIMYGDLEAIHASNALDSFVLAIVQTRMNNRSGLDWIQRCVQFSNELKETTKDPVPRLVVEPARVIMMTQGKNVVCNDACTAFAYWCRHAPTVIDGRYDVSECTI